MLAPTSAQSAVLTIILTLKKKDCTNESLARIVFTMLKIKRLAMNKGNRGNKGMVIALAVFGMLCWGIAPVFAKVGLRNVNPLAGLTLRTLFAAGVMLSWGLIGCSMSQFRSVSLKSWIYIAIEASLATIVGDLAYYAAIKKGEVSLVTIIMSSSPLVTMAFAVIFMGEQITLLRFIGSCLVILGIIFII